MNNRAEASKRGVSWNRDIDAGEVSQHFSAVGQAAASHQASRHEDVCCGMRGKNLSKDISLHRSTRHSSKLVFTT